MGGKRDIEEETCDLNDKDFTSDATIDSRWLNKAVVVEEARVENIVISNNGRRCHRIHNTGCYIPCEEDFVLCCCENDAELYLGKASSYKVNYIIIRNVSLTGSVKLYCHEEDEFIGCLTNKNYMIPQLGCTHLMLTNNQWVPC